MRLFIQPNQGEVASDQREQQVTHVRDGFYVTAQNHCLHKHKSTCGRSDGACSVRAHVRSNIHCHRWLPGNVINLNQDEFPAFL